MILDYKLFTPGQPLKNGTFMLCEQVPGYIRSNDLSQLLQEEGFFGSCWYLIYRIDPIGCDLFLLYLFPYHAIVSIAF